MVSAWVRFCRKLVRGVNSHKTPPGRANNTVKVYCSLKYSNSDILGICRTNPFVFLPVHDTGTKINLEDTFSEAFYLFVGSFLLLIFD